MASGASGSAGGLERFEALLSPPGSELLARLDADAVTPATALRAGTALRAEYPAELVAAALTQHELRIQARAKFGRAGQMFFTRAGLEQASSEVVARYRARRYAHAGRVADLCCGIGGDLIALAQDHAVLAVDIDPLHLRMALANAAVYGAGKASRPCPGVWPWPGGAAGPASRPRPACPTMRCRPAGSWSSSPSGGT